MITATIPVQMPTIETGSSTRQQNTTSAAWSGGFARAARVVIAAGLTALLLWQSDPKAVWQAARDADWRFIVLACTLVAADRVLMAYRWWTLLAPIDGSGRPEGRHYDEGTSGRPEGRHYEGAWAPPQYVVPTFRSAVIPYVVPTFRSAVIPYCRPSGRP